VSLAIYSVVNAANHIVYYAQ